MNIQKLAGNIPVNQISGKLKNGVSLDKVSTDSFTAGENVAQILNSKLKSIYGINSSIEDKKLLGKIYSAVQEFCRINQDDKLFQNLKISTDKIYTGDLSRTSKIGGTYEITFNKDTDWKNIGSITEDLFQKGKIGSKNPDYLFYKDLGDFINFSQTPKTYRECRLMAYEGENMTLPFRLCNNTNVGEFNAHVIASKMCKEALPRDIEAYFRKNTGNMSLKFPESIPKFLEGSKISFKTIDEAAAFLRQYGIKAEFSDIKQANCCAQAVEDLIQAAGSKDIFNGLKIINSPDSFKESGKTVAKFDFNYETFENNIKLNPNIDWQNSENMMTEDFNIMFHPTTRLKDYFTHELSHFLDFNGNPEKFLKMENEFGRFNKSGLFITSKVSDYATEHPAEFCAEYICGKMAGIEYPEVTDKLFQQFWNGCKLNFPKTK